MEIIDLINQVWVAYNKITEEWNKIKSFDFNQKDTLVKSIDSMPDIYKLIRDYREFLWEKFTEIEQLCPFEMEIRVKNVNSLDNKIRGYIDTQEHEFGMVPVNKCLNDLLGLRFIDSTNSIKFNEVEEVVKNLSYSKFLKIIEKDIHNYKAVHIYFKTNNKDFRWELQLWNQADEKVNKNEHEHYKQAYTKFENEYKEAENQEIN